MALIERLMSRPMSVLSTERHYLLVRTAPPTPTRIVTGDQGAPVLGHALRASRGPD
jgi:hypothetical protein